MCDMFRSSLCPSSPQWSEAGRPPIAAHHPWLPSAEVNQYHTDTHTHTPHKSNSKKMFSLQVLLYVVPTFDFSFQVLVQLEQAVVTVTRWRGGCPPQDGVGRTGGAPGWPPIGGHCVDLCARGPCRNNRHAGGVCVT